MIPRFRSLRTKFIIWISIFLVSIFVTQALVNIRNNTAKSKRELTNQAIASSELSSRPLVETYERYYTTGFHKFREVVEDISDLNESITRIQLIDMEGRILFDTQDLERKKIEELERVSPAVIEEIRKPEPYYIYKDKDVLEEIIYPYIEEWGKHAYSLRYFISYDIITREIRLSVIQTSLFTLLLLIVIISIESLLTTRVVINPLQKLEEGARIIGRGNLDYRIHIGSKDEIEELGKQFNEMALKLKESYSGLEEKIKRATKRIKEDKVKLGALLKNLGEGICALDEERNIILFNPKLEQITGYSKNEFINHPLPDFLETILAPTQEGIKKSRKDILLKILTSQFTSRPILVPEFYILTKNKKIRILALVSTPVLIGGKTMGRINIFRDITREKEIEKMKTQFVSIASHQLRTPLTSIKWYLEMLKSGELGKMPEEQHKFVAQVYESNERMIDLVNDLLNVSRVEEGKILLKPQWFSWADLIKEEMKEIAPLAQASNCEILFSSPSLPKVWADPQKVRQVIQNFLSNGIKYSRPRKKGKIEVTLARKDNCILCSVKDSGLGIPEKEQHRIFTKFFRAENIQILQAQGTGLGLFICKGIIEASGGKIWFESKENKGSTFYCTLPCVKK